MRAFVAAFLALALAVPCSGAPLRVAAFNVKDGLGAPGTSSFEDAARILQRINADVVSLEELRSDYTYLVSLQQKLGLPYSYRPTSSSHAVGILSRYPLHSTNLVYQSGMTRAIPLVRVDVPSISDDPWVAGLHLKCCNNFGDEQYKRATELYFLKKKMTELGVTTSAQVIIMGDFNLVSPAEQDLCDRPGRCRAVFCLGQR